jgi:hypothetical protein
LYRPPFHKPIRQLAWADLVAVEPLLATLASIVTRMDAPTMMPDYWLAWSTIKQTMEQLVGWEAVNSALRTRPFWNVGVRLSALGLALKALTPQPVVGNNSGGDS